MIDRRRYEEFGEVISLGLLAERVVLALGRAARSEPLASEDGRALETAAELFDLARQDEVLEPIAISGRMLTNASYLEALRAVQRHGNVAEVEQELRRDADRLHALAGGTSDGIEGDEILALRERFAEIGESAVARANELRRAQQEFEWRPTPQAISHS